MSREDVLFYHLPPCWRARGACRFPGTARGFSRPGSRLARFVLGCTAMSVATFAREFRASARPGACAATDFDDGLACDHGDSGAWLLDEKSAAARTVACLRLCLSCVRCRYISVGGTGGRQERDCSWYAACAALTDEAASSAVAVDSHVSGAVDRAVWGARLRGLTGGAGATTLARMPAGGWSTGPGAGLVRLEFVHVTSNAGTAIERWGKQHGYAWGRDKFQFKQGQLWYHCTRTEGSNPRLAQ